MAEVMSFRLNKEHRRKLLKLANAWNCSQTDVIRRLIERAKLDVIRNGTKNEGDSDVKRTSTDRAKLIAELQQLHAEAEKKRRRGQL
jgi:predicted CopG family antitoxin